MGQGAGKSAAGMAPGSSPASGAAQFQDLAVQKDWYERANENIALQTVYIDKRQQDLNALLAENNQDKIASYAKSETGEFCKGVGSEGAADCLREYQIVQKQYLQWLKESLIQNQDSLGQLRTSRVVVPGQGKAGQAAGSALASKKRILPEWQKFIPSGKTVLLRAPPSELTFDQMKTQLAGLQDPNSAQRSQWLLDFQRPLSPKEFRNTELVLTNENKPSGASLEVLVRNASNGAITFDKNAYNKALSRIFGREGQKAHSAYLAARIKAIQESHKGDAKNPKIRSTWTDHATQDQLLKYCQARQELADYFGPARSPAAPGKGHPGFHDKAKAVSSGTRQSSQVSVNSLADCVKENGPIVPVQGTILNPPKPARSPSGNQADETDAVYMNSQVIDQVMDGF